MPDNVTTSSNPPQIDDAGRDIGPRLAQIDPLRSFGRLAVRVVLAAVLVCAAITMYVLLGQKPPAATGDVARISVFPVHTTIRGKVDGAPGMAGEDEVYDQLLVLAHVRVHNQSKQPITVDDAWATLTLPNGEMRRSLAASDGDFQRVFAAYPQLAPIRMDPFRRDVTIQPGDSIDGMLVFNYPLDATQWGSRKGMTVTVSFANARELTMRGPPS
ncbi:MAG: hypothetical protein ACR2JE_07475 [Acidobacteriaceae bacterium]